MIAYVKWQKCFYNIFRLFNLSPLGYVQYEICRDENYFIVVSGYYKGVDASNVKTKKVLNENCHFWANFNKKFHKWHY